MADNQEMMLHQYLAAKQADPNARQAGENLSKRGGASRGGQSRRGQSDVNMDFGPSQGGNKEMPMAIRNFIEDLGNAVTEKKTDTFEDMYQNEFSKLSEQLMKAQRGKSKTGGLESFPSDNRWPSLSEARQFLGDDNRGSSYGVHLVYQELYYRHIFSKFTEKQLAYLGKDRADSYQNYQNIFDQLVKDMQVLQQNPKAEDERMLINALPISYCWDLLDEYLFQMLLFSQFKAKTIHRKVKQMQQQQTYSQASTSEDAEKITTVQEIPADPQLEQDLALIRENPQIFHTQEVHTLLRKIISFSGIDVYLKAKKAGETVPNVENDPVKYLGYFSYVQLIRYHLLLGEYDLALKTADLLDLDYSDALYYRTPCCHINLMYFLSFSLFMSKRYSDCINICGKILWFSLKIQRFPPLASLYEKESKAHDKMSRLLVLCLCFAPDNFHAKPETEVQHMINDRFSEDISIFKTFGQSREAQQQEIISQTYASKLMEYFNVCCPKFLCLIPGGNGMLDLSKPDQLPKFSSMDSHNTQWSLFWQNVDAMKAIPRVRGLLRMYTSISLSKLRQLLGYASDQELSTVLHQARRAQQQFVSDRDVNGGMALLPGVPTRCSDLDFTIDEDKGEVVVKILKAKTDTQAIFLKEIARLEAICGKIDQPMLT